MANRRGPAVVKRTNLTIILPVTVSEWLRAGAIREGRSISNYTSRLLEKIAEASAAGPLKVGVAAPEQLDLADEIARKVKAGPVRKK